MSDLTLKMDTHPRVKTVEGAHVPDGQMYQFIVTIGPITYSSPWACDTPENIKTKQAEQQEILRCGKIEVCYE